MVITNKYHSAFNWGKAKFYFPDFGAKVLINGASEKRDGGKKTG
jgi:hypothetical protein